VCKARFESNGTVHTGTEHNPAIHVKRMEATAGKLTRDSQPLRHLLEPQETVNTVRVAQSYSMCSTPFPPMRQHAVLFPVGHRLAFKLFRLALLSPRTLSPEPSCTTPPPTPTNLEALRTMRIALYCIGDRSVTWRPVSHNPIPGTQACCHPRLPTIGELLPSSHHPQPSIPAVQACLCPSPSPSLQTKEEEEEEEEGKPLGRFHSVLPWRLIFSSFPPHKTSLLKHRALVRNSTEKETHLAWDLRVASTSDGHQTFARSLHALGGDPARH
jgi:hypothetical protein